MYTALQAVISDIAPCDFECIGGKVSGVDAGACKGMREQDRQTP